MGQGEARALAGLAPAPWPLGPALRAQALSAQGAASD
jgi:hypothetical protein